jgi:hypothetical protein
MNTYKKYFPLYGWFGMLLILVFWYLNWSLDGLRTHWGFFPLWLGYSLFVDALVFYRKGTSLIKRNSRLFILLFLISVPAWWLLNYLTCGPKIGFMMANNFLLTQNIFCSPR